MGRPWEQGWQRKPSLRQQKMREKLQNELENDRRRTEHAITPHANGSAIAMAVTALFIFPEHRAAATPFVRIFFSHPCSIALLIFTYYISFERGGIMSEFWWLDLEHILCSLLVCVPETEEAFCSADFWKVQLV